MEWVKALQIHEWVRRIKYLQDILNFGYDTNRPYDVIETSDTREEMLTEIAVLKRLIENCKI